MSFFRFIGAYPRIPPVYQWLPNQSHCPRPIATLPLSGRAAPGGYLASPSIDAVGRGVEAGEVVIGKQKMPSFTTDCIVIHPFSVSFLIRFGFRETRKPYLVDVLLSEVASFGGSGRCIQWVGCTSLAPRMKVPLPLCCASQTSLPPRRDTKTHSSSCGHLSRTEIQRGSLMANILPASASGATLARRCIAASG